MALELLSGALPKYGRNRMGRLKDGVLEGMISKAWRTGLNHEGYSHVKPFIS